VNRRGLVGPRWHLEYVRHRTSSSGLTQHEMTDRDFADQVPENALLSVIREPLNIAKNTCFVKLHTGAV
jgi:hypothetical protein